MTNTNTNNEMTMAMDFTSMIDGASGKGGSKAVFSDGAYVAQVIGVTREEVDFEGVTKTKDFLICQAFDDNGVAQSLKTQGFVPSLHEKSSCFKLLSALTKETDLVKMGAKLTNMGIIKANQFSFENFIGLNIQIIVTMSSSKSGKVYPKITSILPVRANQSHELKIEAKLPWFFIDKAITYKLMDGIEVFQAKPSIDEVSTTLPVVVEEEDAFVKELEAQMK